MKIGFYPRTAAQDAALGIQPTKGVYKDDKDSNYKALITGPGFGVGAAITSSTTTTSGAGMMIALMYIFNNNHVS
jgi:hypothetical protein